MTLLLSADPACSIQHGIACMLAGAASSRCNAHFMGLDFQSLHQCGKLLFTPPFSSSDVCRGYAVSCPRASVRSRSRTNAVPTQLWPCHMPKLAPCSRRPSAFNSKAMRCSSDSDIDVDFVSRYKHVISQLNNMGKGPMQLDICDTCRTHGCHPFCRAVQHRNQR